MNLRPYTRLNSQNPPIPEKLFSRNYRGHKHSPAKTKRIWFFHIFEWKFPVSVVLTTTDWSVSWKMIPYSRHKLSDLYTLSQSKLLENHTLHSGTYLYSPYMAVPPRGAFILLVPSRNGLALYSASNQKNCDSVLSRTSVLTLAYLRICGVEKLFALSIFFA